MEKELLKKWNIWWSEKKVPDSKKRHPRDKLLSELNKFMRIKEALILCGVRRSGKSTLLYQMIDSLIKSGINPNNIMYFNFDETLEFKDEKAIESVYNSFLEINNPKGKKYLFFDEIQNIENWEKWIKKNYDLHDDDLKFVLTGSNNSLLQDNLSKLLTGRIITKKIFPLSYAEYLDFKSVKIDDFNINKQEQLFHLENYLNIGGFPEAVLEIDQDINAQRLKEYFNNILLRDIVEPQNIREVSKLIELSNYCMTNISAILSYNNISKTIGLNITTLKEYLFFLENAFLIFQLNFASYSLKESISIQKPRKIFSIDNGLRNAISFKFSEDTGKLAENIVFIELKRRDYETYYWYDKNEVDFIIKHRDNALTAINVSYTNKINERETKGLIEFKEKFKSKVKEMILLTKNIEKKEKGIKFIPLWKWLLEK